MLRNPPAGGVYIRCNMEDLTLDSFLALWGRVSGKSPEPGSTMVIQLSPAQYIQMWGEMGVEQASQWKLFEWMAENNQVYGGTYEKMIQGQELMTEEEKASLVGTEESLKGIDWTGF